MASLVNNCLFNPTAGGTTDWTVSTAVTGYMTPSSAGAIHGASYKYRAELSDLTQWEYGEGVWNSVTGVLTRATVIQNSSGTTSKINFSSAPFVGIVHGKEDLREFLTVDRKYYVSPNGLDTNSGQATTTSAVTFTNGSANIGWTGHGKSVGNIFFLGTSGTLPTNFSVPATGTTGSASNLYFVKTVVDANTITASATSGGSAITAGSAGSGSHTATGVSPFLNIQKAINTACALDCSIYNVVIYLAAGTYTGGLDTAGVGCELKAYLGAGTNGGIMIMGAGSTTIIAGGSDAALWARNSGPWLVNGVKFTSTSYWGLFLLGATTSLSMNNVEFGACASGCMTMTTGAKLRIYNHTISGGGLYGYNISGGGTTITCVSVTVTISGSPVFTSALVSVTAGAYITFEGVTWSGTCGATTPRYTITQNGIVYTAGQTTTWLPGTAAHGTPTGSQGQYL